VGKICRGVTLVPLVPTVTKEWSYNSTRRPRLILGFSGNIFFYNT
jgi:hypothetical protein